MFSKFFTEAKKYTSKALESASTAMEEGVRVAKEKAVEYNLNEKLQTFKDKANEMSENASHAFKDAISKRPDDFTYITDNIIAMGFPGLPSHPGKIHYNNRELVARYLEDHYHNQYMIYNLSDEKYDTIFFNDKVMSYDLLGLPCPPLGLLAKICMSIESWLALDEKNIVCIHCLTGKGRTLMVIACLLLWLGEANTPAEALEIVAKKRDTNLFETTLPSQRRYVQYFGNLMDGLRPISEVLCLKQVIITGIPSIENNGFRPIIEVFNSGKPLYTSISVQKETITDDQTGEQKEIDTISAPFITVDNQNVTFDMNIPLCGNIIIRCRHLRDNGIKRSIFRCMFHTGYIQNYKLYLTREQLDGANQDADIPEQFSVSFTFEYMPNQVPLSYENNPLEAYETVLLEDSSSLYSDIIKKRQAIEAQEKAKKDALTAAANNNINTNTSSNNSNTTTTNNNNNITSTTVPSVSNTNGNIVVSTNPNAFSLDNDDEDDEEETKNKRNSKKEKRSSLSQEKIDYLSEIQRIESMLTPTNKSSFSAPSLSTDTVSSASAQIDETITTQDQVDMNTSTQTNTIDDLNNNLSLPSIDQINQELENIDNFTLDNTSLDNVNNNINTFDILNDPTLKDLNLEGLDALDFNSGVSSSIKNSKKTQEEDEDDIF